LSKKEAVPLTDVYIYPAFFHFADDGISIRFPDLPGCLPCAETEELAFKHAREALALHIWGMEEDQEEVPVPTSYHNLQPREEELAALIEVYMPPVRARMSDRYVKKTLSIPYSLNVAAERQGINFSQTLQTALRDQLSQVQK